ncbi:hypothetical protein [Fulvimarina sp. MAC3]|uniref:hypothetical protein n=1 Tax=Fulvimarina sp. MAC3 TaxID=3148887 RepID=UPI0031FBBCBB
MKVQGHNTFRILGLSLVALSALSALAMSAGAQGNGTADPQGQSSEAMQAPPFESTEPGQTLQPNVGDPAQGLRLGELNWAPIESQCGFTNGTKPAPVMDTDEAQPLVFVTMASPSEKAGSAMLERGYIMANGIVRELERGKSAPNREGTVTTVWRSAGEPRINVSVAIDETKKTTDGVEYDGTMTVHWGDKKEVVDIQGRCVDPSAYSGTH